MKLVLQQTFPLGRFHATPWRVNPFDDPYGEWPPSPWRLIRAIVARWYQWDREEGPNDPVLADRLLSAFCKSNFTFYLPPSARRGVSLCHYHPAEFGWIPPNRKKKDRGRVLLIPGVKAYNRTLVRDNYWAVPPDTAIWWFVEGDEWTDGLCRILDGCLERILWFGRAESLTEVHRWTRPAPVTPNCLLHDGRISMQTSPVLVPQPTASRQDVERITDDVKARQSTVPPGARWMYADVPERPPARQRATMTASRPATNIVQFALGYAVAPEPRVVPRLTARFRSWVLNSYTRTQTAGRVTSWRRAPKQVLASLAGLSGLDDNGRPLRNGHSHARYLIWFEREGRPTRFIVWRKPNPFDEAEHNAILETAARDLSWSIASSESGEDWRVKLLPLDAKVDLPSGFDNQRYQTWESVTPYVPPRHWLRPKGERRPKEDVAEQVGQELQILDFPVANLQVEEIAPPEWTAVHVPRSRLRSRPFIGDMRGFILRLVFGEPVNGPIILGHSSHFGLGLFRPACPR